MECRDSHIFGWMAFDLFDAGKTYKQQYTCFGFFGFFYSCNVDVVDGEKKNGKLDSLDSVEYRSHTLEFLQGLHAVYADVYFIFRIGGFGV